MAATTEVRLLKPFAISVAVFLFAAIAARAQDARPPRLEKRGLTTQLIVDGRPFLMLAGELHNSSSSSLEYMKPLWPRLAAIPLNTVLTPISWELIEPAERNYDFTLIDGLLAQARKQHLHIVFLWLAAWKNGMSSYAPVWVKQDTKRYPRVILHNNEANILSTIAGFSDATRDADAHAFAALMQHIRDIDSRDHTVVMMQVENEVGILGDARDHSPEAERAFASVVPPLLTEYLKAHRETLDTELRALWLQQGEKTSGTWAQVFGDTARGDEIFMAWNYARYVQAVTAKGKAAYDLPMYVNTWLAGEDVSPGDYPSGGPQPRVIDVWKAAGSAIDDYSPDLYAANFAYWANRYHRDGNPLLVPETSGGSAGATNVFYAVGEHAAIGFSPFAIDSFPEGTTELGASYGAIASVAAIVLEQQTKGNVHGFTLTMEHPSVQFSMNGDTVQVSLDEIFGDHSAKGFGLIIATGPNEFVGVGKGFRVLITEPALSPFQLGYASIDEGIYEDGKWTPGRRLNGDENDQGNYWRFDASAIKIERAVLYRYR
jgi:beta-galactosidase GanA